MKTLEQNEKKGNQSIDLLKLVFALCIVGIHTDLVKVFSNEKIQWYVMQLVFRLGVPFFFIVSGYFLGKKLWRCKTRTEERKCIWNYTKNLLPAYVFWATANLIVTIPQWNRNMHGDSKAITIQIVKTVLIYPTGAMWFVLACGVGAWIIYLLWNHKIIMSVLAVLSYGFGMLANTYYFLIANTPFHKVIEKYLEFFLNPRNGVHVGFPLLLIGIWLATPNLLQYMKAWRAGILAILSAILLVVEMTFVYGKETKDDISLCISFLFLLPCVIVFFLKKDVIAGIPMRWARELSTCIFYTHCFFRTVLREFYHITEPKILYLMTITICLILFLISRKITILKKLL